MRIGFYTRLALSNIKKNGRTYLPYIITCIITVMMFYMIKSLSINPGITQMYGARSVSITLTLGCNIVGIFAVIFLFYTNSFLIRRRKKEFGLFNILGMEKKHMGIVLFMETLFTAAVSLIFGFILGVALDKAMFLLLTRAMGGGVTLGFFIAPKAFADTGLLFGILFLLIYIKSVFTIKSADPITLLHGGSVGEKEPKARWLLTLAGLAFLGWGYYIAITIINPVASIEVFFVAVALVIAGTYLLFTAGSVTVLKLLRKNKKFYYKTNHFISVSGMIYRMKQNAVGLSNICILSTMVLVMVSATSCMIVGMEDILHTRFPNEFGITSNDDPAQDEVFRQVDDLCADMGIAMENKICYTDIQFAVAETDDGFITDENQLDVMIDAASFRNVVFIPLSDYNASTGENRQLGEMESLFYSNLEKYAKDSLSLFGMNFGIKERLDEFYGNGVVESNIISGYYCIVRDEDFERLKSAAEDGLGIPVQASTYYGFDCFVSDELKQKLREEISAVLSSRGFNGHMETRFSERDSFMGLYGSFFFLGICLGFLFVMATVLIIYYKQISEGYDDRERFVILQKVGMSRKEVKSAIHSQVLTVFFLPLVAAGVHTAAAFHLMTLVLSLLNMLNVKLFFFCTLTCFLVFGLMYILIYALTARIYYRIVSR